MLIFLNFSWTKAAVKSFEAPSYVSLMSRLKSGETSIHLVTLLGELLNKVEDQKNLGN